MKVIAVVASIFTFSTMPMPASAQQGCNPWFTFGCYPQPGTSWFPAPLPSSHDHRREHVYHHGNDREYSRGDHRRDRREYDHKSTVAHTVYKPHIAYPVHHLIHHQDNDVSQDRARERITEQVKSFCSKYPHDKACHQIEQTEQKKEE